MKHLTREELTALLSVSGQRDRLMFMLAANHGLRVSETINLTMENFKDGYITVQRLKGSLKTSQKLLPNEAALLAEYKVVSPDGKLFPFCRRTALRHIKALGAKAGIPIHKCFNHALKHTTAKLALKGGMGLPELKQYLGHRSLSSTGAYLQSDDEEASMAFAAAMGV
jgi:integrase